MKNYAYYIGVDVSKKTLDITVLKGKEKLFHVRVSNDEKGIKALKKELKNNRISANKSLFCLENTGFHGHKLSCWAVKNAYHVWLENAIAIKRSLGLVRGKNDKVDSYRIALYAFRFEDKCTLWQPKRKSICLLQQLNATRKRLMLSLKILKVPLKENALIFSKAERKITEKCCTKVLKELEKSIKEVEKQIAKIIQEDTKLSRMNKVITSVNGVGRQIAAAFIVATNEFKDIQKAKKLACYVGVVPFENTSGTSIRGKNRVSHLANKSLKSLLHMGALSAIKNSDEMREYYNRKVAEGKPKMVVINAIRNKLVSRIFSCVKHDRMYEKNYTRKVA